MRREVLAPRRVRVRGLTLIEITVALAIAALLFGAVVMGVGALTGAKAKEASVELAGTIRSLYDSAALTGRTCRLVFHLPQSKEEDGEVSWRAECAKGQATASLKRDDELKEARTAKESKVKDDSRFRRLDDDAAPTLQELQEQEKKRIDEANRFANFESETVGEKTLPSSVRIEVWTSKQHKPAKDGVAYLYFFPQGYTERAQVWVKQGSNTWTLTVAPLTGKTKIFAEELELPRT